MDSSQKKIDQAFQEKLRKRFDDLEAPVEEELSKKVLAAVITTHYAGRWGVFAVVILVLSGLTVGYFLQESKSSEPVAARTRVSEKNDTGRPVNDAGTRAVLAPEQGSVPPTLSHSGAQKELINPHQKVEDRKERINHLRPAKANEKTIFPLDSSAKIQLVENRPDRDAQYRIEAASRMERVESGLAADSFAVGLSTYKNELSLLSGRKLHFPQYALPDIQVPTSAPPQEEQLRPHRPKLNPVFSIASLESFQLINVHSTFEMPFQNVQFAPAFSSKSIGYKVSAGLEKGHLRLLLNYGYLRNWNYYEIGSGRIEVNSTTENQYSFRRVGLPHVIDERLHLLGGGVRTLLPMSHTPLRKLETRAGIEFTSVLPTRLAMIWVNISSTKNVNLGKNLELAVGPYAEYSLTQRSLVGGHWQSRPYRIGVAVELRKREE